MYKNKDYETHPRNKMYIKHTDTFEDKKQSNLVLPMFVVFIMLIMSLSFLFTSNGNIPVEEVDFSYKDEFQKIPEAKEPLQDEIEPYNKQEISDSEQGKNLANEAEPDFGPYMEELQIRIKNNWHPPREDKSKRIIALFKVDKEGNLLNLKITASSGNKDADFAAVEAIKISAPFKPLPPEYEGEDVDIQFNFDYNVFNKKRRKYE